MEAHVGTLNATERSVSGTGQARKLRARGLIPAVIYGRHGGCQSIAVDPAHLHSALDPEKRQNTLIKLTVRADDGSVVDEQQVMLKAHQVDAVKQTLLHADFVRVASDQLVHADVPVETVGRAVGVQMGGVLNLVFRTVPVECTPERIPGKLTVDVTPLDIGSVVTASALAVPEHVRVCLPPDQTVVAVVSPRAAAAMAEGEVAEEGAEATEGASAEAADKDKAEGTAHA